MTSVQAPILAADHLSYHYPASRGSKTEPPLVLSDVSLNIDAGEVVGLIGESGSGKSTLSLLLAGLVRPTSGQVLLRGEPVASNEGVDKKRLVTTVQYVFQDPSAALDPRMPVFALVKEGLDIHRRGTPSDRVGRVSSILSRVGVPERLWKARPAALSGGLRQRVALARSLVLDPDLLILDEPVSALDVITQKRTLDFLDEVREALNLTYLVVLHDLAVAHNFCSRVMILEHGRIVEEGPASDVLRTPQHAYTKRLIAAVPEPDPARKMQVVVDQE